MKTYCDSCNILVSPNDPTRQKMAGKVWHGNCFRNLLRANHADTLDEALQIEEVIQRSGLKGVIRISVH